MNWRELIKKVGVHKISNSLNVTYSAVFMWTKDAYPDRKFIGPLVKVMQEILDEQTFEFFVCSFNEDVLFLPPEIFKFPEPTQAVKT